jgi:DNA-binding CsgD family transcriptional regulator
MLQITPVERLVLQLLAEGKSTNELADCLARADGGELDTQLKALFSRLGVETPVEAVAAGVKRGLIDLV